MLLLYCILYVVNASVLLQLKVLLDIIAHARDEAVDRLDCRPGVVWRGEQAVWIAQTE